MRKEVASEGRAIVVAWRRDRVIRRPGAQEHKDLRATRVLHEAIVPRNRSPHLRLGSIGEAVARLSRRHPDASTQRRFCREAALGIRLVRRFGERTSEKRQSVPLLLSRGRSSEWLVADG